MQRFRRNGAGRGADVAPEGEERVELLEEGGVPRPSPSDIEVREGGVAVYEGRVGDRQVFVAPEPAPPRQVEEEVGVAAHAPPRRPRLPVVATLVIYVAPAVPQAVWLQARLDEAQGVTGVEGERVLLRVVV